MKGQLPDERQSDLFRSRLDTITEIAPNVLLIKNNPTMKNLKQLALAILFLFSSANIALACGGTFYACGAADVVAHGFDFWSNCSEGDRIQVVDLCHPAEQSHTFCLQSGPCNEH